MTLAGCFQQVVHHPIHVKGSMAQFAEDAAMFHFEAAYDAAEALYQSGKRADARAAFDQIVAMPLEADNSDGIRAKELSIYRLDSILAADRQPEALMQLLRNIRPFFAVLPKAKTTKIVRKLFDSIFSAGASHADQLSVCEEMIAWAREEKRTFLRHRLEHRLALTQFEKGEAREALQTISTLLREVRRLDDRSLLVDIYLLESRVFYAIRNMSKSRAALVSARTNANAIYCPPLSQAEIDLQSGVLHAEEHDAKTAYSYFYEAFEGYHNLGDHAREARMALQYMILAKIATDNQEELNAILQSKNVLEYRGRDTDALRYIASAYKKKDTHAFNKVVTEYHDVLYQDDIMKRQLTEMYDSLLERHLLKIIEPYQRVQISYLAELLKLDPELVESRVSQMILDKKLLGIVDQQQNCLIVFEAQEQNAKTSSSSTAGTSSSNLYQEALKTLESLDRVVTALFDKVGGKFDNLVEENIKKRKNGGLLDGGKKKTDEEKKKTDDTTSDSKRKDSASQDKKDPK